MMTGTESINGPARLRILDGDDQEPALVTASEAELVVATVKNRTRFGGSLILDTPRNPTPVWGAGNQVLWSSGEPMMIVGPSGVGKTTLGTQDRPSSTSTGRAGRRAPRRHVGLAGVGTSRRTAGRGIGSRRARPQAAAWTDLVVRRRRR